MAAGQLPDANPQPNAHVRAAGTTRPDDVPEPPADCRRARGPPFLNPECGFGDASGEASGEPGAWIGNGGATSFGDGGTLCRTWSWRLTVPGTMGGGEVEVASRATSSAAASASSTACSACRFFAARYVGPSR